MRSGLYHEGLVYIKRKLFSVLACWYGTGETHVIGSISISFVLSDFWKWFVSSDKFIAYVKATVSKLISSFIGQNGSGLEPEIWFVDIYHRP